MVERELWVKSCLKSESYSSLLIACSSSSRYFLTSLTISTSSSSSKEIPFFLFYFLLSWIKLMMSSIYLCLESSMIRILMVSSKEKLGLILILVLGIVDNFPLIIILSLWILLLTLYWPFSSEEFGTINSLRALLLVSCIDYLIFSNSSNSRSRFSSAHWDSLWRMLRFAILRLSMVRVCCSRSSRIGLRN